jgi:glucan phosphoethanolaminetransferase (alkaline phosphatase superfamily)
VNRKNESAKLTWKDLNLIVPSAALAISVLDIVFLERKYNVFSGGFLQTSPIVALLERAYFCTFVFLLEFSFASACWCLLRLSAGTRNATAALSRYQFIVVYGVGSVFALIAKYKILSYFGDLISLAVLRNLGGGDLRGALLYSLEDGRLFLVGACAMGLVAWIVYRRLKRRPAPVSGLRTGFNTRWLLAALTVWLVSLCSLTYGASNNTAKNRYYRAVSPYWLASEFNKSWRSDEPSALALLSAHSVAFPKAVPSEIGFGTRKDNLFLVVAESTRSDVLDAAIAGTPVTPTWRMLGREGSVAHQYYSHTGFTTSSLKAIFNGALNGDRPLQGTLFEVLKRNGYQIIVLSAQDEAFGDVATDSNLEKTADIFFDARSAKNERVFSSAASGSLALSNKRIVEQFDKISPRIDWKRPIFMYVNLQAAHFPYFHKGMPVLRNVVPLDRADISSEKREQVKLTYLNAVGSSDAATGQLVDRLRALGIFDKSLFVVSGDHGESLFEDGILGHGVKITDTQMHTLLVANRRLPELNYLMGETGLAHSLLMGIGATDATPHAFPTSSVFQYIGDLQSPVELGYKYADGRYLVLDNVNAEVRASELKNPCRVSELPVGGQVSLELLRLVSEWRSLVSEKAPVLQAITQIPVKK